MTRVKIFPLFAVFGLFLTLGSQKGISSQNADTQKVILVELGIDSPGDAGKAYSSQFDLQRVEIDVPYDDPLFTLEDYAFSEDALDGPDCFMPQLKMIFREDTYVFSLYCTSVVRYRNQAPFKPSSRMARSDIKVTESVLDFLQSVQNKYFGDHFNPETAKKFHEVTRIQGGSIDIDYKILDDDEDEAEDAELEQDAMDKEGWFDNVKDPGLEQEDSVNIETIGDDKR